MNLSVVVCAKNSESTLKECLESVKANHPSEIILVHGECRDKTLEIAREYTNKIFFDNGKSLAHARNLGLKKAKEGLISFTDADTIVPKDCYSIMANEMKNNHWVGIHAQIVAPEVKNYLEWGENKSFHVLFNNPGKRHRIGTIVTLWNRNVLLKHKFDPFLRRTSEDQDLCIRLANKGYSVGVSKTFAYHRHRTGFKSFARQKFQYGEGNARLAWKYHNLRYAFAWALVVPYGLLRCFQKKKYLTGVAILPYLFLTTVFTGTGVFYRLTKLFLGNNT